MTHCNKPPKGWYCTREAGHEGPCAAIEGTRPTRQMLMYGDGRTIHGTTKLDIEVDKNGKVVAVWFRCIGLPFQVTEVEYERATEMRRMSLRVNEEYKIHAIKVEIPK